MKTILLTSTLMVLTISKGITQDKHTISEIFYNNKKAYLKTDNKPLNGLVIAKYENGQLKSEERYKDGVQNGISQSWYENGQLWKKINYVDGQQLGARLKYYETGQLKEEASITKEERLIRKGWHENGKPMFVINYGKVEKSIHKGKVNWHYKLDGLSTAWYKNGQVKYKSYSKNDYADGVRKKWYENGQLKSERRYKVGAQYGPAKSWYENGQLKYVGFYKEGNEIEQKCWDINGKTWKCKD